MKEILNAMIQFLAENIDTIIGFITGGGLLSFFTFKYTRTQAKADAMKSIQEVYRGTIDDLRKDKELIKKENAEMRDQIMRLQKMVTQNCSDIRKLKADRCIVSDCKNRKTE